MAKLGETDPRWIVAERHDGVNVNSWHWDQRDKSKVCEEHLKDLFKDRMLYECEQFVIESKSMSGYEGDVTIANRKGKLRCFFEIKFTLKVEARPTASGDLVPFEGKMIVVDCDTQNYVENFDINVDCSDAKGKTGQDAALKAIQTFGREAIRNIMRNYIEEGVMAANGVASQPMTITSQTTITKSAESNASTSTSSPKPDGSAITFDITWSATLADIWDCFTKEDKISCFTRSPCSMKSRVCGDFSMLGGAIKGTFVELSEQKRLVMKWRLSSWKSDEGTESLVTIDFSGSDGSVRTTMSHAGVPTAEVDRVKQGWETNFWDGMKMILGYNNDYKKE